MAVDWNGMEGAKVKPGYKPPPTPQATSAPEPEMPAMQPQPAAPSFQPFSPSAMPSMQWQPPQAQAAPAAAPEPALAGLQAAMDNPGLGAGWQSENAMGGNPMLGQRSYPQAVRFLGSLPRVY